MSDEELPENLPLDEGRPWEQLPVETNRQFATFRAYRDMHPLERSMAQVGQKLGMSTSYLERLSAEFQWIRRVGAFDREQDRLGQARRVRQIEEMNERHADVAASAIRKVAERLKSIDSASLRPNELARLLEVASKAERMARGLLPDEPVIHERATIFNADEIRRLLKAEGLFQDCTVPEDSMVPPAQRSRGTSSAGGDRWIRINLGGTDLQPEWPVSAPVRRQPLTLRKLRAEAAWIGATALVRAALLVAERRASDEVHQNFLSNDCFSWPTSASGFLMRAPSSMLTRAALSLRCDLTYWLRLSDFTIGGRAAALATSWRRRFGTICRDHTKNRAIYGLRRPKRPGTSIGRWDSFRRKNAGVTCIGVSFVRSGSMRGAIHVIQIDLTAAESGGRPDSRSGPKAPGGA